MAEVPSAREQLVRLLLREKQGLTVDELASALRVSRNAVRQHLAVLEKEGLVAAADLRRKIGRPSHVYRLTALGVEAFPKQYALLSRELLAALKRVHGPDGTRKVLEAMAESLAEALAPQVRGHTPAERLASAVALMNRLEYDARVDERDGEAGIAAFNCVFSDVAPEHREVCDFDVDLLSRLVGHPVSHRECMAAGAGLCRFVVPPQAPGRPAG